MGGLGTAGREDMSDPDPVMTDPPKLGPEAERGAEEKGTVSGTGISCWGRTCKPHNFSMLHVTQVSNATDKHARF
jgi:hypothetical protein